MSVTYLVRWECDRCPATVTDANAYMPDGWVHTMDGRDLCPECQQAVSRG